MWGFKAFVVFWLSGFTNAAVRSWSQQAEKQPQNIQFTGPTNQLPGLSSPQFLRTVTQQVPGSFPQYSGAFSQQLSESTAQLPGSFPQPQPGSSAQLLGSFPQLPPGSSAQQPGSFPQSLPGSSAQQPGSPPQLLPGLPVFFPGSLPQQQPGSLALQSGSVPQQLPGSFPQLLPGSPAQLPGSPAQLPGSVPKQLLGSPAQLPGSVPKQLPGSPAQLPGSVPQQLPGSPAQVPGSVPQQQPGSTALRPGSVPQQLPGSFPQLLPGSIAQLPGPVPQQQTGSPTLQPGFSPQLPRPHLPQLPGSFVPPSRDPQQLTDGCQLDGVDKVPCGQPGIDASQCGAINCCFDGQQCHYGRTVTVQCTIDGQFVLVVARDATLPRISLDSISLLGGSDGPCGIADYNADFAIYQFPVTACGTRSMVQGDYVVYENKMVSSYEVGVGPLGAITRDSHYELYFQCRYSTTTVASLAVELSSNDPPLPVVASGPLRVELRLGNGQCVTKGCVEGIVAYTSYYTEADYPVTKVLREPVYVEVRMLERTDPNLVLVLGRCWATSTPNPNSVPQWDLLVNGCPYRDDRYLTTLVPLDGSSSLSYPSHYKRFVLKMFTFVDPASMAPLKERVYIHCSTAVCSPTAGATCVPRCNRRRRDVGSAVRNSHPVSVVSSGEVIYTQTQASA